MKIWLYTLKRKIDITEYVDKPTAQNKVVGAIFDSAVITIPSVSRWAFSNEIDLSYRIQRMSVVVIENMEDTRQYYVVSSNSEKKGEYYDHTLELQEPSVLLKYRPLPDLSTTQPVEEATVYINQIKGDSGRTRHQQDEGLINRFNYIKATISTSLKQVSNDVTIIEDDMLKEAGTYKVNFSGRLIYLSDFDLTLFTRYINNAKIMIMGNNEVLAEESLGNLVASGYTLKYNFDINITKNITINNPVTLKVVFYGDISEAKKGLMISLDNTKLEVSYRQEYNADLKNLDYEVKKIVNSAIVNVNEFKIDENTLGRLATIKAFDDMKTEQTLYDALNRIANYVKAKVRLSLDLETDGKIIWFDFYDIMEQTEWVEVNNDQVNIQSDINEYTSAFELKNNNILKDNYITERVSLRATGVSQITTDNIIVQLSNPIDKVVSVEIAGKVFKDTSNVDINASRAVNITQRVVLEDYYNTLDKLDYSAIRPSGDSQNNHLYYTRGDDKIKGLSQFGVQYEKWLDTTQGNRALYETMACVLQEELDAEGAGRKVKHLVDSGIDDDFYIVFKVKYLPFSESNAVIYKDNQSHFEEKIIRKLNANDRVNSADMLGGYAREKVNAVGGTRKAISGIADRVEDIPKLASRNGDYRVVSVTKYSRDNEIDFIATLVKDYLYESEYIGIDSDRRLHRIPKDNYVNRVDRALNILYLSKEEKRMNKTSFNLEGLVSILTINASSFVPPKLAYLYYDNKSISSFIDVNAIANVIEFRTAMKDNYSAGYKKLRTTIDDKTITYQRDVPYTDIFGNVEFFTIMYYANMVNQTVNNFNEFPENQEMGEGLLGGLSYEINKDTRERSILSNQIAIMSDDDSIYVYNGIAEFNRQVMDDTKDIRMARLGYKPNRYDKYIDLSRTESVFKNNAELYDGYIEFSVNFKKPYAWFDNESKKLLLVVDDLELGTNRIYFYGTPYELVKTLYTPVDSVVINNKLDVIDNKTDLLLSYDEIIENIEVSNEVSSLLKVEKEFNVGFDKDYKTHDLYLSYEDVVKDSILNIETYKTKIIESNFIKVLNANEAKDDVYIDYEGIKEAHLINSDLGLIEVAVMMLANLIIADETFSDEYIDYENITELHASNIEYDSETLCFINFTSDLKTNETIDDNYIGYENISVVTQVSSEWIAFEIYRVMIDNLLKIQEVITDVNLSYDNLLEIRLLGSDLGLIDVESSAIQKTLLVNETIDDDFIDYENVNESELIDLTFDNKYYKGLPFDLDLMVNDNFSDFQLSYDDTIETLIVGSDLGVLDLFMAQLNTNIKTTDILNTFYLEQYNETETITLEVSEITKYLTLNRDVLAELIKTDTVNSFYLTDDNILEEIEVDSEITKETEIPFSLDGPTVTLVDKTICKEITVNISNTNDVEVEVYRDNVYFGTLSANSDDDYTFSHTLNGGGAIGGLFVATIKFVYEEHSKSYRYEEMISSFCMLN